MPPPYIRFSVLLSALVLITGSLLLAQAPEGDDPEELQERAMKAAVAKVAPCVVQIETSGGSDLIGSGAGGPQIRKGVGPTTGLIVGADGHVISSSFNFANNPVAIFVSIPGHKERYPAKVVAKDQTRMLTLLKINAAGLPVPVATPRNEIKVGLWSLAVGRTWSGPEGPPSVSAGIISAVNRIWGKAIQTDAKVSPVNYGGPLVDVQGRVMGVLVPASPRAEGEAAGVEWYDSGIGFAIPLEDINAVLPRLRQGQDLKRGLLGITMQSGDIYGVAPTVATVAPESAAAKAGIQPGDTILELDGVPVVRQAQIMHHLGSKYEGDVVSVKVKRGGKEIALAGLKLSGLLTSFVNPFLGILPLRDDPELGVEVRFVYPKSPADAAGLKAGDRVMKLGKDKNQLQAFSGRDELMNLLSGMTPGTEVTVEFQRKGAKEAQKATVKLGDMPDAVPAGLPAPSSLKKALEPRKTVAPKPAPPRLVPPKKDEPKKEEAKKDEPKKEEAKKEPPKKAETGLLARSNAARDHRYWVYVPESYDPNIAHALVVWLHPAGKGEERDVKAFVNDWEDYCHASHLILVCPQSQNERGWLFSEADSVLEAAREVMGQYTIDRQRVVAHGMGGGGALAFYLAFQARDVVRGVATTGSVNPHQPKENLANQRLSFYVVAGEKDPLVKSIEETKAKLLTQKFPVVYREIRDMGHQYLDEPTLDELIRWVDSLDRL